MVSSRAIPAVFVSSEKNGSFTGATAFENGSFRTDSVSDVSKMRELRGGKDRKKILIVDTTALNDRRFNPFSMNCCRIPGSDVWLLNVVRDMDDLVDAFIGGMTKLVFPVHLMRRGFTLKDVAMASDACVPAVICVNGRTADDRDVTSVVDEVCTPDFPNVLVMDCDGGVSDDIWNSIISNHPGLCVFSPSRTSVHIRRAHVLFETLGDYSPKQESEDPAVVLKPGVKAVVFDIDGTMMLTHVDYSRLDRAAYDHLTSIGVPESELEMMNNAASLTSGYAWLTANGRGDEIDAVERAVGDRLTEIEMENPAEAVAVPGIVECIRTLKEKGFKVAALTRGGRTYAEHVLGGAGILELLDIVAARDDHPYTEGKPNRLAMERTAFALGAQPSEVLFVGDTATDWKTSVASGCQFIGVTTGPVDEDKWHEIAGEDVNILPSAADVTSVL